MANQKHTYQHDCDQCVFLGTIDARSEGDDVIDCYWCGKQGTPSLASVLGRFGNDGPDYYSSNPPEAFAMKDEYLLVADRWYLYALIRAMDLGLYVRPSKEKK